MVRNGKIIGGWIRITCDIYKQQMGVILLGDTQNEYMVIKLKIQR